MALIYDLYGHNNFIARDAIYIYIYYIVFAAARTKLKRAATVKHHVHYALYIIACSIIAYWASNTDPVRRFKNPENYFSASEFIHLHNTGMRLK